jgi:hypothetical protein
MDQWNPAGRKKRTSVETLVSGLAFGVGFSVYWFFHPEAFWPIFPIIFAGVLPFASGLRGVITGIAAAPGRKRQDKLESAAERERSILRIAQREKGLVAPSLVALESSLSLDEAQTALEDMAKKGHAAMQVTEDGRIVYEFREFLPR